eukprot:309018_1
MNYFGTYKWHIQDGTLINKILSAKCESYFESDEVFQVGRLNWQIRLHPNGLDQKSKGYCAVGVVLLGIPSSWKSIFCQLHIECSQMQNMYKLVFPQSYNK